MHIKPLFTGIILLASLLGCGSQPPLPTASIEATVTEPEQALPSRPFPAETLYSLLVAEIAGSRERYDIALGNYVKQAHITRDPGVTARATRIAQYLGARQAALDTALLWVQVEPTSTEARLIAATELAGSGRLLEAFEHSRHLLEVGSQPIFQTIATQAAKVTATQRELLLTRYQDLLDIHPQNKQLLVGKGLLLQQQKQYHAALDTARTALSIDADFIPAAILEAKLLYLTDQPDKALQQLARLLQRHPNNKRLRVQYARLLANQDLEAARKQFQTLVQQSPADGDLLLSLALVSRELKLLEQAQQEFQRLLALGKRVSTARYYLGRIAEDQGQANLALEHYMKVGPGADFLPSILQSSRLMIRTGNLTGVSERLSYIRQTYPKLAERLYLLESELLAQFGHEQKAIAKLDQGLNQLQNNPRLLYSRAMLHERQGDIHLLERDLRKVLEHEPNNATALNALGYTLADRTSRVTEAHSLISRALNLRPNDPAIIDSMGWVQYRLGNYEEALLRLRQAMKALPDHEIAAHLGEVLWSVGQQREAREVWSEGLRLKPDSQLIPAVIKRLKAEQ